MLLTTVKNRWPVLLALLLSAWALGVALTEPPRAWGDAPEYLLMAESLAAHSSPDLRSEDLARVQRRFQGFGIEFPPHGQLIGYYEGNDSRRYSYHFWAYSLATLPARALLRPFGVSPLQAPQVTNALLLAAALFSLAGLAPLSPAARALSVGLLFFSPVGWFVLWPHPEVMSASLATLALVASARASHGWAVLLSAMAAWQNPQLLLLTASLWALGAMRGQVEWRPELRLDLSMPWQRSLRLALPALVFFAHPGFYLWRFGTPSIVANQATSVAKLSVGRALGLLFDLNLGLLPYVPGLLLVFLGLLGRQLFQRTASRELLLGAAFAAMLLLNTLQWNYNHGSSGPSRYLVWMLPIAIWTSVAGSPSRGRVAALGLALIAQGVVFASRDGFRSPYDYLEHSPAARFVLDRWPALYEPDYEIFIKRTLHVEGPTRGPYVYVAGGRCRKVLAKRTMKAEVLRACGSIPEQAAGFFDEAGTSPRANREWTYLSY